MMMLFKRTRVLLIFVVLLVIAMFIPFDFEIAPERKLKITDESGQPVESAMARQIWYQYSLGVNGQADFKVNSEGAVTLPERSEWTSAIKLFLGGYKQFSDLGIHASYGSAERVAIFADKYEERWFRNGKGLERNIVTLSKEKGS